MEKRLITDYRNKPKEFHLCNGLQGRNCNESLHNEKSQKGKLLQEKILFYGDYLNTVGPNVSKIHSAGLSLKNIARKMRFSLLTGLFLTALAHAEDPSYAMVNVKNDESKEISVYIQNGDGTIIRDAKYQVSFNVPKGDKKSIRVEKSQMGDEETFSVIGGTGAIDKTVSMDNRCKNLRFGAQHDIVFKSTQMGATTCHVTSSALDNNQHANQKSQSSSSKTTNSSADDSHQPEKES